MLMKEKSIEKEKEVLSHIWVKSESDLDQISTRSLTSSVQSYQSWYARNTNLDRKDEWYYVNKEKFNDSEKVLNEFHKLYSNKSR